METLILQTENNSATNEILEFIKKMKTVKFISVENVNKELVADDWAIPGRPATDKELNQLSELLDKENKFKKSDDIFDDIIKSIKK